MKSKPVYKEKECKLCGSNYKPTSPKQKVCIRCIKEAKKLSQKEIDRLRNREKYNIKHVRLCESCDIEFITYYSKKVYCGSEECEQERVRRKNKLHHFRRSKEDHRVRGRQYYKENIKKSLEKKAETYRVKNPNAKDYIPGKVHHTIEFIAGYIEGKEYKLLSTKYINCKEKILLECPEGHKWETTFNGFRDKGVMQGSRCPKCSNNGTSKFEQEVKDFVLSLNQKIIENDRTTILNPNTNKYLELDILFPCKTKAIECNGVYWHDRPEVKERDKIKQDQCKEKDIKLLTITDEEWNFNQEDYKNKIVKFILKNKF